MGQQFHNGGKHDDSVTISNRDTKRYAVVNPANKGLHHQNKPNKHGKTQRHYSLSDLALGTDTLPSKK